MDKDVTGRLRVVNWQGQIVNAAPPNFDRSIGRLVNRPRKNHRVIATAYTTNELRAVPQRRPRALQTLAHGEGVLGWLQRAGRVLS